MDSDFSTNYLSDLTDSKLNELDNLIYDLITIDAYIENFIVLNNLDEDEVWLKIDYNYIEMMNMYYG